MPLLRITARQGRPTCHDGDGPLVTALRAAHLRACPGPVVIMLHGYKYAPGHARHCPHETLQGLAPAHALSWPRQLGVGDGGLGGLAISFGWDARGSVWQAWRAADRAGLALSLLLAALQDCAPGRAVHVLAHSMGARVALAALALSEAGAIKTAILLTPAEFSGTAARALQSPAGRAARVLHVASTENALFDMLVQGLLPAPVRGDRAMGRAQLDLPNLATLRLDDLRALEALRALGFGVAAPERRVCHWSAYRRPGLFALYRAVLAGQIEIADLRTRLPHVAPTKPARSPLPFAPKLSH